MPSPDPERIRRAVSRRGQQAQPPPDEARLRRTPLEELQHLAVNASSESVRVQATRVLLERADMAREREEARKAEARQGEVEDGGSSLRQYVQEITGEALDNELDALLAGTVEAALADPDRDAGYPHLVAAFRRAIERHAAALADVGRIEAEVERRAQERAEHMYRSRSFAAVACEPPQEPEDASAPVRATELPPQPPEHAEDGTERPDDRALVAGFPSRRSRRRNGRLQPPSVDERMGR
ncbi:MAG: hypothetical protein ACR2ML_01715 [Solirubrobacteraceae bacterium]